MFGKLQLRPWEFGRLTPGELIEALDDDLETPRPANGGRAMSHAEVLAHAERRRTMTLRDRIAEARAKGW